MPDPGQSRIYPYLLRTCVIGGVIFFAIGEFLAILAVILRHQLHLGSRPGLYLLPFLAASPPVAGFQAYVHIKRLLLSKGIDPSNWQPIWYELALLCLVAYAPFVLALVVLLPALQSITR